MIEPTSLPLQDSVLPTGRIRIPVCVGDLPGSDYRVDAGTTTYEVVKYLRDHEELPGVMVYTGDQLANVLPRLRMFERLGQMYGTDLFIRKPIEALCQNLHTEACSLPADLRVNEAVQTALLRPLHNVYDPLVCVAEDQSTRLVDMHTLLVVQSQILSNLHDGISNLERVKRALARRISLTEAAYLIIDAVNEVVAFHQAAVSLHRQGALHLIAGRGFPLNPVMQAPDTEFIETSLFQTMARIRQSITVEDVDKIFGWTGFKGMEAMICWVGVPLFAGQKVFGLINFARTTRTPFRKDEKDTLDAYARLFSEFLEREQIESGQAPQFPGFKVEPIPAKISGSFIL